MRSIAWKNSSLVNVCDADLIGQTLTRASSRCTSPRSSSAGNWSSEDEAARIIKESSDDQPRRGDSVNIALSNKLGSPQAVEGDTGRPFLMIYRF